MKNYYFIPAIVVLGFLVSILSFQYLPNPYIWIFLSWGIISALGSAGNFNSIIKSLLINIAVVFFTLSVFEAYWREGSVEKPPEKIITYGFYKSDDVLGYRAAKNFQANAKLEHKSEMIYDVTYTLNSNGLRKAPPFINTNNQPCILFFGGSVTFGEGVNDEETMPYRVGVRTGGEFQVHNFGFIGYGPHQMLAAIEKGLVEKTVQCSPKHIVYQGMWSHIKRSAGQASWDQHGPRYTVGKQGEAIYSDNFDSDLEKPGQLDKLLKKSPTYSKIFGEQKAVSKSDTILYHAILIKARDLFKVLYPQALFQVFYWDYKEWSIDMKDNNDKLVEGFKENQIPVHLISNILPDFHDNQAIYNISPHDGHPNPMAHDKIAQYIAEKILVETE
ncbi:MAG: hypothetical protein ACQ9MH_05315 [Nitrospinales bacterium]